MTSQVPLRRFSTTMGWVSAGVMWLASSICSMTSSYMVAAWPRMEAPARSSNVVAPA